MRLGKAQSQVPVIMTPQLTTIILIIIIRGVDHSQRHSTLKPFIHSTMSLVLDQTSMACRRLHAYRAFPRSGKMLPGRWATAGYHLAWGFLEWKKCGCKRLFLITRLCRLVELLQGERGLFTIQYHGQEVLVLLHVLTTSEWSCGCFCLIHYDAFYLDVSWLWSLTSLSNMNNA